MPDRQQSPGSRGDLAARVSAIHLDRRLDASDAEPVYLAVAGDGTHVRMSADAFRLIDAIKSGIRLEDLAAALNDRPNREPVRVGDLRTAALRTVESIERAAAGAPAAPRGFWATRPLLHPALVAWVADRLTWLYAWPAVVLVTAVVIGSLVAAPQGWFSLTAADGAIALGYVMFLGSLVVHEFGHAAACRRFGLAPGAIGFTMYILFPALYTDVTRAWALTRRQRVVVDLAGNYVQAPIGAAYLVLFGVTGAPAFGVAASLVALGMLFSLNPVFKCDGYWLVADALGVTNLSAQPGVVASAVGRWIRRGRALRLPWPPAVAAVVALYSVLSLGIWMWFLSRLMPMLIARFSNLDVQLGAVADAVTGRTAELWSAGFGLAVTVFLLTAGGVMIGRLGQSLLPAVVKSRLASVVRNRASQLHASSLSPEKASANGSVPR